jgi:hypothetical protein
MARERRASASDGGKPEEEQEVIAAAAAAGQDESDAALLAGVETEGGGGGAPPAPSDPDVVLDLVEACARLNAAGHDSTATGMFFAMEQAAGRGRDTYANYEARLKETLRKPAQRGRTAGG